MIVWWTLLMVSGIIAILWVPLSIVIAPFAAAITMRQAYLRRLNIRYYGLIGALYSACLFIPWTYLFIRMRGRRFPIAFMVASYVMVYSFWALFLLSSFIELNRIFTTPIYQHHRTNPITIFAMLMVVVGIFVAVRYALVLTQSDSQVHLQNDTVENGYRFGEIKYVVPFMLAEAQAVVFFLLSIGTISS